MLALRPRTRADLVEVELDDELVILDEASGDLHHLNHTASAIFALCDGTSTIAEIAHEVAALFDRTPQEIRPEVDRFVGRLGEARLLGEPR